MESFNKTESSDFTSTSVSTSVSAVRISPATAATTATIALNTPDFSVRRNMVKAWGAKSSSTSAQGSKSVGGPVQSSGGGSVVLTISEI